MPGTYIEYGDRTSGRPLNKPKDHLAGWMQDWKWNWWVTLTFSRDVNPHKADAILDEFLDEIERIHHDCLSCLIAQEQKTVSGAGKPGGRVHFHLVVAFSTRIPTEAFSDLWSQPDYGGDRTSGSGTHIGMYDPAGGALDYMMKWSKDPACDYRLRNPDLISPLLPESFMNIAAVRRRIRRAKERSERCGTGMAC